jgi:hypothetical protein
VVILTRRVSTDQLPVQGRLVGFHDQQVVPAAVMEVVGVSTLSVQRVRGQQHIRQVDAIQQRSECGDLAVLPALAADLGLPEDHPARVIERGQQMHLSPVVGARAAGGFPVDRNHPHSPGRRVGPAYGQPPGHRDIQRVQVNSLQDPADRGFTRSSPPQTQPQPGRDGQILCPFGDRDVGAGAGQHRAHADREHGHQPMPAPARLPRIGHRRQRDQQIRIRLNAIAAGVR